LDTQAPKTSGDGMKEGLFITIRNDVGEELPYENYSGGEKLKITVAIAEALGGLQKVGFRVFDELFIGLDQDSTEAFASVLERMQERFPQVVCISHLQEIKDLFDEKLTCVKINGVTKII
jgi:exonuclease SbcC